VCGVRGVHREGEKLESRLFENDIRKITVEVQMMN